MTTKVINYTEARQNLAKVLASVREDCEPVEISTKRGNLVIISKEDLNSLIATAELLQSPVNAKRLADARLEVETGKTFSISDDILAKMCE